VTITGFTVRGAIGEGILAAGSVKKGPIRDITIYGNTVLDVTTHTRVPGQDREPARRTLAGQFAELRFDGDCARSCGEGYAIWQIQRGLEAANLRSINSGIAE
jgi:hypothetical protein